MDNISTCFTKNIVWRWLPLIVLMLLLILFFSLGFTRYLSFSSLKAHRDLLLMWTAHHYVMMVFGFIVCYILVIAISLPASLIFTLTSGFLFGVVWGTAYVLIAATIGSTLLFLAVQNAFAAWFRKKVSTKIALMRQGFQQNAFTYLLILRLIPVFPFFLVNIVPALLDVPVKTFMLATFLGIIPGTFIYVMVGNGLGFLFDNDKTPDLSIIFTPTIILPLIGLALLSTLPLFYKRFLKN